jgi:hypothetical protein
LVGAQKMNLIDVFITSIFLYSAFRYVDVLSTKICLAKLDPKLHEVNPIAAPLFHKLGFNKTMVILWIPFALVIGIADTLVVAPVIGIPILWLFFGLFHLLAAVNNFQVYSHVKLFGAEAIEENTKHLIQTLKSLSKFKKITFLLQINLLNVFFALYGIVSLVLFSMLLGSLSISLKAPIPVLLLLAPVIMILDFIVFFPTMAFGSLIISLRRLSVDVEQVDPPGNEQALTVSIEFLENLVNEAHQKGANCVQFPYNKMVQGGENVK